MSTISFQRPHPVAAARSSAFAAAVMTRLSSWIDRFDQTRAATTARRAEEARIREASALRRYAHQFQRDEPRFAADLLAAADRHELTN